MSAATRCLLSRSTLAARLTDADKSLQRDIEGCAKAIQFLLSKVEELQQAVHGLTTTTFPAVVSEPEPAPLKDQLVEYIGSRTGRRPKQVKRAIARSAHGELAPRDSQQCKTTAMMKDKQRTACENWRGML
jgi:hypothetical protein